MKRLDLFRFCAVTVLGLLIVASAQGKDPKPAADAKKSPAGEACAPVDRAASEAAIRAALDRPILMEFVETPLDNVFDYLRDAMRIPIVVEKKVLDDLGIALDLPITFSVKGISARSALNLLLRPLELDWMITDEVLLITSCEQVNARLSLWVYEVADLVVLRNEKDQLELDFDSLIEVITTSVEPASWDHVGGPGSIAPFGVGAPMLSVRQTERVHQQLGELLAAMRKAVAKKLPDNPPKRIPEIHQCQYAGSAAGPAEPSKPKSK